MTHAYGRHTVPRSISNRVSELEASYSRLIRNYPIQGASGSMLKLASIYYRRETIKHKIKHKAFIVNKVHDEIIIQCDKDTVVLATQLLAKAMKEAVKKFCKKLEIPAAITIESYWKK